MGVTPNTDISCNREIKFGALLERLPATSGQRPWFATGHYARKAWLCGRPQLVRPADKHKDQTYYLSSISESGLRRALFPLSELPKPEVRELARKHGLHNAERPDSVGICFVGEKGKFKNFLADYIPANSGPIVNQLTGKVIGEHAGLWNFTIGESSRLPGMPTRMSVSRKDTLTNTVYVVPGTKHEELFTDVLHVPDFTWIWRDAVPPELDSPSGFRAQMMHRYRMAASPCTVTRYEPQPASVSQLDSILFRSLDGGFVVRSDSPQHAVAPGQIAVLYNGDWCLGCGPITSTARSSTRVVDSTIAQQPTALNVSS